jgi:pimeloyl-ACP methyl ester carboxylesterase
VIEGEKTNVPHDSIREWAKTPLHARLLLIPDAGHATFVDQPASLLREIEIFLGGGWPINSKEIEKS